MSSKIYDILKWVAIVGLYGLSTLVAGLGEIWNWPYTDEIVKTINIIGTALGIWLSLSSVNYYKVQSTMNNPQMFEPEEDTIEEVEYSEDDTDEE